MLPIYTGSYLERYKTPPKRTMDKQNIFIWGMASGALLMLVVIGLDGGITNCLVSEHYG